MTGERPPIDASGIEHQDTGRTHGLLRLLAWGAGLYCVCIAGLLLFFSVQEGTDRWLENTELKQLRAELAKNPENQRIKERIRRKDQNLRRRFWVYRRRRAVGGWLLLAGGVVWLAAQVGLRGIEPEPNPSLPPPPEERTALRKRERRWLMWSSGGMAAVLGAAALIGAALAWTRHFRAIGRPGQMKSAFGTPEWFSAWPQFRGPFGSGLAGDGPWPLDWDVAAGRNVAWTTDLPADAPGNSSPIVWGNRIFLTGANQSQEVVMCFSSEDGRLLWRSPVTVSRRDPAAFKHLEVMESTGFAAPTPVTDGRYVVATFVTADIAAFDLNGKQIWGWNAGLPDSAYGLASSLILYQDRVIWQLDQGQDAEDGKSALYAIDIATGRVVWRTPRPVPNSWATPTVVPVADRMQIIACGNPWLIAYDAESGQEVWRARVLDGDVAPSPTWYDTVVCVTQSGAQAAGVRCNGRGDVTDTHVVWTSDEGLPDTASPVTDGKVFVQAGTDGLVTCLDARTGKLLWEHEYPCGFEASPIIAGGRIYLWGDDGTAVILEAGPTFRRIALMKMGEPVRATPAFVGGRIYVRGRNRLFCIDAGAGAAD